MITLLKNFLAMKSVHLLMPSEKKMNTPGPRDGPGGHDRALAIKRRKSVVSYASQTPPRVAHAKPPGPKIQKDLRTDDKAPI